MSLLHSAYLKLPREWRNKLRYFLRFRSVRSHVTKVLAPAGADSEVVAVLRRRSPIDLVVHVGAHLAEEGWLYESLGAKTVLWIEADPELFLRLSQKIEARSSGSTTHMPYQALVSEIDDAEFQLRRYSNDGASNSIYSLSEDFQRELPSLTETGEVITVRSETLPTILENVGIDMANFSRSLLVLDVQGHELAVLKGSSASLTYAFALICVEVSMESVYVGGASGDDVIRWLSNCGFQPVTSVPSLHGDLLMERSPEVIA